MINTDGNIIIGTSVDVGGINTGLRKISKMYSKIGKMMSLALGITALTKLGKSAIEAASDLQEVQNIVDVSFTKLNESGEILEDLTGKVEAFASTAIEKYGMSELAAKQTASSFMAMGKAMGFSMKDAANMSLKLTALTGDMSSFYNISQDYARVALSAVFTGETETLKRYGIILTEANLQEYAATLGIQEKVKAMSAQEKALLRYQYVLQATKDMEGDFIRTGDSWANQVRVLQEVWRQFLITMGSGLISVFTPVIKFLNQVIQKLIQLAQVLWSILSNLFGIKIQDFSDEMGKLADTTDDAVGAEEDLGDAVEDAGKKVTKALQPFDELNAIRTTESSSAASSIGDLGISIDDFDVDDIAPPEDEIKSAIDSWYEWGQAIGKAISDFLAKIDWEKIYAKFKAFGKHVAEFLNGFMNTDVFKRVAEFIAKGLNAIIYALKAFAEEFEWETLGLKIAEFVNEFFSDFDFAAFAQTINKWVQGIWTTIKTAVKNIDWDNVWAGLKEFFTNLDPETIGILAMFFTIKKLLSLHLLRALVGGVKTLSLSVLKGIFKSLGTKIATAAGTAFTNLGTLSKAIASGLGKAIANGFSLAVNSVKGLVSGFVQAIGTKLSAGFADLQLSMETFRGLLFGGNGLKASAEMAFGPIATAIAGIVSVITGSIIAVKNFFDMWEEGWSVLKTILEAIGIALAAVGAVLLGAEALVAGIVAAIIFAVSQLVILIHDNWEAIKAVFVGIGEWFKTNVIDPVVGFFQGLWSGIVSVFQGIWNVIVAVLTPIVSFVAGFIKRVGQIFQGIVILFKAAWIIATGWLNTNVIQPIIAFFVNLMTTLYGVWISVVSWIDTNIVQPVTNFFVALGTAIANIFSTCWQTIVSVWGVVSNWFNTKVIIPLINFFSPIVAKIGGFFKKLWNDIKSVWGVVVSWFQNSIINPVVNAWKIATTKIGTFFSNLWNGIVSGVKGAMNSLISVIEGAINGVIDIINWFLSGFNSIVSAAAKITGDKWGGVDLIQHITVPRLAKGAVIPPNNEFMAILGDQKHGTNIETPLSTMTDAFNTALDNRGGGLETALLQEQNELLRALLQKEWTVGADGIFKSVQQSAKKYNKATGKLAFQ